MFKITPFTRGTRYIDLFDPFSAMKEFENSFLGHQLPAFKTDIRETEQAYILEAELPGFSKEDISIEIKNGYLTIHAEHKSENQDKTDNYLRRERSYGSFTRCFDLDGINNADISAAYKDGILTLTLPKAVANEKEGRRIDIQ